MKILRINDTITVVLNNGEIISSDKCSDDMFNDIFHHQNDEEYIKKILLPEFQSKREEAELKQELFDSANNSKILTTKGSSVYMLNVSELSLPEDLVSAILKAEKEENEELIKTYINFWTLVSLNPDSRCRTNLFWFLNKYGMIISKSGLFVAYRNVEVKREGSNISAELADAISKEYTRIKFVSKKSPKDYYLVKDVNNKFIAKHKLLDSDVSLGCLSDLYTKLGDAEVSTVYTDQHTRKFEIKIGEVVSMPRENCDSIQENTCSRGLHVAGKEWLQQHYFGKVGLMVLVNPADVVAVPPQDSYGKMRTCAYYPVSVVEYNEDGKIKDMGITDGFEDDFIDKIVYNGNVNNDDSNPYSVGIPDMPEIDKSKINKRLLELAKQFKKVV